MLHLTVLHYEGLKTKIPMSSIDFYVYVHGGNVRHIRKY